MLVVWVLGDATAAGTATEGINWFGNFDVGDAVAVT